MKPCRGLAAGIRATFRRNQGVRVRSTIVGTLLVAIALVIGAAVMLFMLNRADSREMYNTTGYHTYEIAKLIRDGGIAAVPSEELNEGTGADVIQVIDDRGQVVARSSNAPTVPLSSAHPPAGQSVDI